MMLSSLKDRSVQRRLVSLAAVLVIGSLYLPQPFDGDQALFATGAREMSRGSVLYRDFWDIKQPGIFLFYLLAGKLFGFHEVGIHAFELLYMAALAGVLLVVLRCYYESPAIGALVPLLSIGIYYAVSRSWHLTQVEGLAGLPLFLCLWFAWEASRRQDHRAWPLFLSGLMGGVVLLFKFLFLPLILSFWLILTLDGVLRKQEAILRLLGRVGVPILAGLLPPLLLTFVYFARFHVLGILAYTFFEYPTRALTEIRPSGMDRLIGGLEWFDNGFAPLIALGFIGACASLCPRRDVLTAGLAMWVILGLGVIFIQRNSRWEYHYLLLFVPIGILATRGLDVLWVQAKAATPGRSIVRLRLVAALGVALLLSPVLLRLALHTIVLAQSGFALGSGKRMAYQCRVSERYQTVQAEVSFLLRPDSLPGSIFVFGDPVYYVLSHRFQATALNGWMGEFFLPEQWTQLTAQLAAARPPYIHVGSEYRDLVAARSPATMRFLRENYGELRHDEHGEWYVRKG